MDMILADSNILLYIIQGLPQVEYYIDFHFGISIITEIEVLGLKDISKESLTNRKRIIDDCYIIERSDEIKKRTILLKQSYTIKTPDAIIAATAIQYGIPLLSADKGFLQLRELDFILLPM